jgi:hypothetical protein
MKLKEKKLKKGHKKSPWLTDQTPDLSYEAKITSKKEK